MRIEEYTAMFELEDRLWWFEGMRAITGAILDRAMRRRGNPRLLDVGCGTGYSLAWLRERYQSSAAFGVDVSMHAAALWKRRSVDTVAVASADSLPFESGKFDLVTCFDVIYQLDETRAAAAFAEVNRVLTPGGLFFIREPAYEWMRGSHDIAVATDHRYTLGKLKSDLRQAGFEIKRGAYANTLLFGAAAAHRVLSRIRRSEESDVKPVASWMNRALASILKSEAVFLERMSFPFGLSAIVLAAKI
ncbi:MAG: methyltransferase type 11 [Blastocatellia bacterium AA13]|nr:MAG: methyltransferase type 11 [Blastocatellia bacterium AA13]